MPFETFVHVHSLTSPLPPPPPPPPQKNSFTLLPKTPHTLPKKIYISQVWIFCQFVPPPPKPTLPRKKFNRRPPPPPPPPNPLYQERSLIGDILPEEYFYIYLLVNMLLKVSWFTVPQIHGSIFHVSPSRKQGWLVGYIQIDLLYN